jgi:hypothetical protein
MLENQYILRNKLQRAQEELDYWRKKGQKPIYQRIGNCNSEKCLFQGEDAIEGYGYFEGYYSPYRTTFFDNPNVILCDAITVTGGTKELIDDLIDWVRKKNALNRLNERQQLVLTISLANLSNLEKRLIKNSSPQNKIKLKAIRNTPQGRGAAPCEGTVDIIGVEKVNEVR